MYAVMLAGLLVGCHGSKGGGDEGSDSVKEKPRNTSEFSPEALQAFLDRSRFDMFGGEVRSQYLELDGHAPRELLVEVRCVGNACAGDHYSIKGSLYFLYDLSTSLDAPELWTPKPISMGPGASVQVADVNSDGKDDLLLSGATTTYSRSLKIYSVMGRLLSTRFEGEMPQNTVAQLTVDLDQDGSVEIVTLQRQVNVSESQPYPNGYYQGSMLTVGMLDNLVVQSWDVRRGNLNLKTVENRAGLGALYERQLTELGEETSLEALSTTLAMLRVIGENKTISTELAASIMSAYDKRAEGGDVLKIRPVSQDPYHNGYPQYDAYGNLIPPEASAAPSFDLFLLLAALTGQPSQEVRLWAQDKLTEAGSMDEVSAFLELTLSTLPADQRDKTLATMLEQSLDVLITEGPQSPNFYNLAYIDPYNNQGSFGNVQRSYFVASYLLDEQVKFDGKGKIIRNFLTRSTREPYTLQTLLPQYPFITAIAPHVMEMDFSKLPSEVVTTLFNQVLPHYISTVNQQGGLNKETKERFIASVQRYIKANPGRQSEVMYFITNYMPDPSFGPIVAPSLKRLRDVFESGRATQEDRNNMYTAAAMLPLAMSSLSKKDREWWINYVYRQGMGYTVDASLSAGCYDLRSQTDEQIETILDSMETLPRESTVAASCLPYMLGVYDDGVSPLAEKFQERLPELLRKRLKVMEDEYQIQQFLVSLDAYDKLSELESELWGVVKRRKSNYFDTARYQALVMLARLDDARAKKQLEAISKDAFTDSAERRKASYFNEYFYVDALARQKEPYFNELLLEMGERKDVIPSSCHLIRDYLMGYDQVASFDEAKRKRHEKLCGGASSVSSSTVPITGSGMWSSGGGVDEDELFYDISGEDRDTLPDLRALE